MEVSVTLDDLLNISLDALQEAAGQEEAAITEKPDSPETETEKDTEKEISGAEQGALAGLPVTEKTLPESGQKSTETVYIANDSETLEYLNTVSGQLEAISLQLDNQTAYLRDGNMSMNIILGVIAGLLFVHCLFQGRR